LSNKQQKEKIIMNTISTYTNVDEHSKILAFNVNEDEGLLHAQDECARTFTTQALTIDTEDTAEQAWYSVFRDTDTGDFLERNKQYIISVAKLITGNETVDDSNLNNAFVQLKDGLGFFEESLAESQKNRRTFLVEIALQQTRDAIAVYGNPIAAPQNIGGYMTAVSQYVLLARQVTQFQLMGLYNNTDILNSVSYNKIIEDALNVMADFMAGNGMDREISDKVGVVEQKGDENYKWGFKYKHDGLRNFLRNGSENELNQVRKDQISVLEKMYNSVLVQPDVLRCWRMILADI
jgi:hypothetical protein